MNIALAHTHHYVPLPERHSAKAFGYDLAVLEDTTVAANEAKVLPTGFALARDLPFGPIDDWGTCEGVAMLVLPRSSLFLRHGLLVANSPGLIDADYSGPIGVIVWNTRAVPVDLAAGTRVAQLVFVRLLVPGLQVAETDSLRAVREGFGSTG